MVRNPVSANPLARAFVIAVLNGAESQWVRKRHGGRPVHAPHERA